MLTHLMSWRFLGTLIFLLPGLVTQTRFRNQGSHDSATDADLPVGANCPPKSVQKLHCGSLPKDMQPVADALINQYPGETANKLPPKLKTKEQIITWFSSLEPPKFWPEGEKWSLHEGYRYKGYLFLTIKIARGQKRGDPKNLAHCIIVNLRQRTYHIIYLSRTDAVETRKRDVARMGEEKDGRRRKEKKTEGRYSIEKLSLGKGA
jgi:hypothetical protein